MNQGCMIVIDGSNGAGKTTVIGAIRSHLEQLNRQAVFTREPGGTLIGEKIREILLATDAGQMAPITELMLFAAARAQHVREKIVPALRAGKVVVCDRFDSATISFQHHARGLPLELITTLNDLAVEGLRPDLTIVLDLDPEVGLARVGARGSNLDRLEEETLEFLRKARDGYLTQARLDPDRFAVIDASRPVDDVISKVLQLVDQLTK
ncbi:dTMP kinase [Pseudomonas sp. OIL-1]|uniref:dTMP kinase n=1 Tax=Pseudomonas sp. OIL-1 TaxID=2706126 RepID=UPI0013A769C6|nr:dTMP kinase [Pseudomonas sp. OIL-1]QIB52415.1 dTMP kinase [Pseudomonas sp. OIL-1]